ncbi:MAG TPA: hypothetical protein DC058_09240 [Planctomycetaceae bacterium]|nr:hypothetical protein [Planctomycetaceae bacterium]HBC61389.1 hypothetical protein [Planctomycetaceae bacterium]
MNGNDRRRAVVAVESTGLNMVSQSPAVCRIRSAEQSGIEISLCVNCNQNPEEFCGRWALTVRL